MRLRKNAKIDLLSRVPLFSECSKKELGDIAAVADELDVADGAVLIKEGARGREFFVLVDGSADVVRGGTKVDTLGPGDFFGEIALVSDVPRTATVTTTSPSRVLVVTDSAFRSLIKRVPTIAQKVLAALGQRIHQSAES